jgi:hypothetical protein
MKRLLFLLIPFVLLATEPEPVPNENGTAETAVQEKRLFYPPDEVSEAAISLRSELDDINASLKPSAEVSEKEAALPAFIEALETMRSDVNADDLQHRSVKQLIRLSEQSKVYRDELAEYEAIL